MTMSRTIRDAIGPQVVGGRYFNGYWREEYTVLAISVGGPSDYAGWSITVASVGGRPRTHCTPWDYRCDRVVAEPIESGK